MGWVIRVAAPARVKRGRGGSTHPSDLYYWKLWSNWPWRKRVGAASLHWLLVLVSAGMMVKIARRGGKWADLAVCVREHFLPREVRNVRDNGWEERVCDMVSQWDKKGIDLMLNRHAFPKKGNILFDKHSFAAFTAGLPGIRGVPTFGADDLADGLPGWVEQTDALIFKPGFSSHGHGIYALRRGPDGWRTERDPSPEAIGDLLDWARRTLRSGDVVQKLLSPPPELAPLSPGALPTLRVVTCLDEQGEPEVTNATLRVGSGAAVVDNFGSGGFAATVDLATGRAGAAHGGGAEGRVRQVDLHPATGARIAGFVVPDFQRCLELARLAHRAFAEQGFTMIGWDIGLDAGGPVLIEGNWNPNSDLIQIVGGRGLAATRLGELYLHHLSQVPDRRWRESPVLVRG